MSWYYIKEVRLGYGEDASSLIHSFPRHSVSFMFILYLYIFNVWGAVTYPHLLSCGLFALACLPVEKKIPKFRHEKVMSSKTKTNGISLEVQMKNVFTL